MKLILCALLFLHVCNAMNLRWFEYEPIVQKEDEAETEWRKFKLQHNKLYGGVGGVENEEGLRKAIFLDNFGVIKKHNSLHQQGLKSFKLGVNKFADMTLREFRGVMNGVKGAVRSNESSTFLPSNLPLTLPTSVDWRKASCMVSEVKDQGRCGSCWAFSTTGSLEGQQCRKSKKTTDLSEQNLVDCSSENNGCDGGLMSNAFKYIKQNHGIDTETSYPYKGKDGSCHFKKNTVGATVTGYVELTDGDEDKLKEAVASVGPVSVAIDASQHSFMLYHSGVYDEPNCSTQQLDHGVLVVGYGSEDDQDFWIVKNSWSSGWGENGFIRMSRNHGDQCGIASMASYPLV